MNDDSMPAGGEKPADLQEAAGESAAPLEKLQRELEEAIRSSQAFKDQFLRKAAEFENYKRRSETEYLNLVRNANEALINALLPIVEDFTRSLKSGSPRTDGESFARGVELIYGKLMKVLESQGLTPFESAGKPFDVDYHDALLQVERADVPAGTVVEEIARGYKLNDKVLRHAKVIVSAASRAESAPGETPAPGDGKESTPH